MVMPELLNNLIYFDYTHDTIHYSPSYMNTHGITAIVKNWKIINENAIREYYDSSHHGSSSRAASFCNDTLTLFAYEVLVSMTR